MHNPDKYIRKYFYNALLNMEVNFVNVMVYDTHTPNNEDALIILSTQTGSNDWTVKCGVDKNRTIVLDVITRYQGHSGSRLLLDDIIEEILSRTQNIEIENFIVDNWEVSFPQEIITSTSTETIFRKLINYTLKLK